METTPLTPASTNSNTYRPVAGTSEAPRSATDELIQIYAASNSRDFLRSNRLPDDQRFDGNHNVDFENCLTRFERTTTMSKAKAPECLYELKHYFSKDAAKICELYERGGDPEQNLKDAISHLKKEYGYQARSAQAILERLLAGGPIPKNDSKEFKKFRINLEGEVTKAQASGRANSFDNADTINKILRKKLSFLTQPWANHRGKKLNYRSEREK